MSASELDKPKNAFIAGAVVVTCGLVGLLIFVIGDYFVAEVREEISDKILRHQDSVLIALHGEEQGKLTKYQWVDQKAGVVRIPLDRALELTLKDWPSRPSGPVAAPETAPAAPALPVPGAPDSVATKAVPVEKVDPKTDPRANQKVEPKIPPNSGSKLVTQPASPAGTKAQPKTEKQSVPVEKKAE